MDREEFIRNNLNTRKALQVICSPRYRGICKKDLMKLLEIRGRAFNKLVLNMRERSLIRLEIDSLDQRKIKILPGGEALGLWQRLDAWLKRDYEKLKKQLEELGIDTLKW